MKSSYNKKSNITNVLAHAAKSKPFGLLQNISSNLPGVEIIILPLEIKEIIIM